MSIKKKIERFLAECQDQEYTETGYAIELLEEAMKALPNDPLVLVAELAPEIDTAAFCDRCGRQSFEVKLYKRGLNEHVALCEGCAE
jgi:hypothetical protein